MLTTCPECGLQVSDKAASCPHCGYPMVKQTVRRRRRMRLPNGFGQISQIKGRNLRKPFRAMITVGKDENGKPICKLLEPVAYFETYNEAYEALIEYNKSPIDKSKNITMDDLFTKWIDTLDLSDSRLRLIRSSWKYAESLHDLPVTELRVIHVRECIDKSEAPVSVKPHIKTTTSMLLDYAVECGIIDTNLLRGSKVDKAANKEAEKNHKEHFAFTKEELDSLWENINVENVDLILIQCYTGLRPQEMIKLKTENIHLDKDYLIGGMKTEAGTDRTVPIHSKIKPLLAERVKRKGIENITYGQYAYMFEKVMSTLQLNPDHRPHDARKTFVTLAKEYNMDEYAIKRIVGHKVKDITEAVYTERKIDWLKMEIEKIKA